MRNGRGVLGSTFAMAALLLSASGAARAGDGALEINPSCVASGCFPGDNGGFPVETVSGKRYVLTAELTVDANTPAVSLAAGATLDLNGFSITGPVTCNGTPVSGCPGAGSGIGVRAVDGRATIRNGRIAGVGSHAIQGGNGTQVIDMVLESNGGDGVFGGDGASGWVIRDCRIARNGGDGVRLNTGTPRGSFVTQNDIWANGGHGVRANGTLVLGNAIHQNDGNGVLGDDTLHYGNNSLLGNDGGAHSGGTQLGSNLCNNAPC
jgi:hypothetical protein